MSENIYQKVTDHIVRALENGPGTWSRPWTVKAGAGSPMPHNVASGAHYRGINTVMLWCAREAGQYPTHLWGTYQQWQDKGAQVRKGEKSTPGVFFKPTERTVVVDGEEISKGGMIARGFSLFNVAQVDGYVAPVVAIDEVPAIDAAEAFFAATGAVIRHGGDRAYYSPMQDFVAMPERNSFRLAKLYYSTLAHECVHWTSHASRLDRKLGARFGDEAYAAEELIAELGAAFTCAQLGLDDTPRDDHAQYIASWIRVLKRDPRAIFTASSAAQRACDYLLALQAPAQQQAA
jgi:antirestriction protein ArdC